MAAGRLNSAYALAARNRPMSRLTKRFIREMEAVFLSVAEREAKRSTADALID